MCAPRRSYGGIDPRRAVWQTRPYWTGHAGSRSGRKFRPAHERGRLSVRPGRCRGGLTCRMPGRASAALGLLGAAAARKCPERAAPARSDRPEAAARVLRSLFICGRGEGLRRACSVRGSPVGIDLDAPAVIGRTNMNVTLHAPVPTRPPPPLIARRPLWRRGVRALPTGDRRDGCTRGRRSAISSWRSRGASASPRGTSR
jgi:hypothetical protein